MIEVAPNLFVGSGADLIYVDDGSGGVANGWHVITSAKAPWHRDALGYTGRAAPKDHPEYLIALRKNRTILNLIDAPDPAYIPDEIIDAAIGTIDMHIKAGERVLVHCNEGKSRAPTIAMLWMALQARDVGAEPQGHPDEIAAWFKNIYPDYAPGEGMRLYAQRRLEKMLEAS
jgi:hypothetical protein